MSSKRNLVRSIGFVAAASVMLVAGSATSAQLKAAGPQPGDCKRAYEAVIGPSAPAAQAMWAQMVAGKLGSKWANWVGAKNKAVIVVAAGPKPQFQARAQPCFYHPVP